MDSGAARSAGVLFETLLFQRLLEPLAGGDNAMGSYGTLLFAQRIAESDARGFGAVVTASLERAR